MPQHIRTTCGSGGTGRRTGFRFQRETVGVQVPSSAPYDHSTKDATVHGKSAAGSGPFASGWVLARGEAEIEREPGDLFILENTEGSGNK